MAYDQLIKMITSLYSRELVRKTYEDEAERLEKFIEKTEQITVSSDKGLNGFRLNAQVRGLTGARKPNYHEFILFSQYFDADSVFLDYPVFSRHRACFKLVITSDKKQITRIIVNNDNVKDAIDSNVKAMGYMALYTSLQALFINHFIEKWLIDTWHFPKLVVGVVLGGIVLFFITVILRIQFDNDNLHEFVKKLNHKNNEGSISLRKLSDLKLLETLKNYWSSKFSQ